MQSVRADKKERDRSHTFICSKNGTLEYLCTSMIYDMAYHTCCVRMLLFEYEPCELQYDGRTGCETMTFDEHQAVVPPSILNVTG